MNADAEKEIERLKDEANASLHPHESGMDIEPFVRTAMQWAYADALKTIDAQIKRGELQGNGWDDLAQNGGRILAYNDIFNRAK